MTMSLLILGGTLDASALARVVAERGIRATLSYAGRVAAPRVQPVPTRVGGFGGAEGLAAYLRAEGVTHLVDATHPFAARISANAVEAAAATGVQLIALVRPPWAAGPGDRWVRVPDVPGAVRALDGPPARVFLALGRLHLAAFASQPQHRYLLRLVDPPGAAPLPGATVVVARGPFDVAADTALLRAHGIERIVAKNAGGAGAEAKLIAARALGVPVVLIDRPAAPMRAEVATVGEALGWLGHEGAERGV